MTTKTFRVSEKLHDVLSEGGRWDNYLSSQIIVHGFDTEKPYSVRKHPETHEVVIIQESEDEETGER